MQPVVKKYTKLLGWKPAYSTLLQTNQRVWVHCTLEAGDMAVIDDVNLEYAYEAEIATRIRGCLYMNDEMYALRGDKKALMRVERHPGFRPLVEGLRAVDGLPWEIHLIEDGFAYAEARKAYLENLL